MVKRSLLLLMALPLLADVPQLTTECLPAKIYVGQPTTCTFTLRATEPMYEVEVARFPEFRGFWTENLTLRQGGIVLMPVYSKKSVSYQSPIGSYSLLPMIGRKDHRIESMKVIIRANNEHEFKPHLSEAPNLTILPLPPAPANIAPHFLGAVGQFEMHVESRALEYQKNEPVTLRLQISGDGNVPDILAPKLKLPLFAEIVSQRSVVEGNIGNYRKTFEYVLSVHDESQFSVEAEPFYQFDPSRVGYSEVSVPSVQFQYVVKAKLERPENRTPVLEKISTGRPTYYFDVTKSRTFWWMNVLGLFAAASALISHAMRLRREAYESSLRFHLSLKYEIAMEAFRNGKIEEFLRLAEDIAMSWGAGTTMRASRRLTLMKMEARDAAFAGKLSLLFDARDRLLYSPEKQLPLPPDQLLKTFEQFFRLAL